MVPSGSPDQSPPPRPLGRPGTGESRRDPDYLARSVSLGLPTRRCAQDQILGDASVTSELGHLNSILTSLNSAGHPQVAPPPVRPQWARAFEIQERFLAPDALIASRQRQSRELERLAASFRPAHAKWVKTLHKDVRPVLEKVNMPLFAHLLKRAKFPGADLPQRLSAGRPIVEVQKADGAFLPRKKRGHIASLDKIEAMAVKHNLTVIQQCGPSRHSEPVTTKVDDKSVLQSVDHVSWDKSQAEVHAGSIQGWYDSLEELADALGTSTDKVVLSSHAPIVQNGKVRNISNLRPVVNKAAGYAESYIPDGPEGLSVIVKHAIALAHKRVDSPLLTDKSLGRITGFPSDYKGAYRQCPLLPRHARFSGIVTWDPLSKSRRFGFFRSQPFGSCLAPNNWSEISVAMTYIAADWFGIAMPTCVDDVATAEDSRTTPSAHSAWLLLNKLLGWTIEISKSPPPSSVFDFLGLTIHLPDLDKGEPYLLSLQTEKVERYGAQIQSILKADRITRSEASKLRGRLGFAASVGWCGAGRGFLPVFSRIQHGRSSSLSPLPLGVRTALEWFLKNLPTIPPMRPAWNMRSSNLFLSYADGVGTSRAELGESPFLDRSIGFVVLPMFTQSTSPSDQISLTPVGHQSIFGQAFLPPSAVFPDFGEIDLTGVCAVEAMAPLLTLLSCPEISNCLWVHFVDNNSALYGLLKGQSSGSAAINAIAALTWDLLAKRSIHVWFERVPSKLNLADPPSRGASIVSDHPLLQSLVRAPVRFPACVKPVRSPLEHLSPKPLKLDPGWPVPPAFASEPLS